MAPKIAHKHHRGHGQPPLGLQGPAILATQFVLRFVWTSSTDPLVVQETESSRWDTGPASSLPPSMVPFGWLRSLLDATGVSR